MIENYEIDIKDLQARIDELKKQDVSGILKVVVDEKITEYEEMIQSLEYNIEALEREE